MTRGRERLLENPFYVLGVAPTATQKEIEREGQKLLSMLEVGLESAKRYSTPVGEGTRDADRVRRAMAELRDPARRLSHELWALQPTPQPPSLSGRGAQTPAHHANASTSVEREGGWAEAFRAIGWRGR